MSESYKHRVIEERDELAKKEHRLRYFIAFDDGFSLIGKEEQDDLCEQLGYMAFYLQVLNRRIGRFKSAKCKCCGSIYDRSAVIRIEALGFDLCKPCIEAIDSRIKEGNE